MSDTIYIKDLVYIPIHDVDMGRIKEKFSKRFYAPGACQRCEQLPDRHGEVCETCPAYHGKVVTWRTKTHKGVKYVGLPVGSKKQIANTAGIFFKDYRVVDKRNAPTFDYRLKFTLDLYDYQKLLVDKFLKHGYGMIEAPPRTGKTAVMLAIAIKLGYKAVLIADQHEFLEQFLWHIEGNEAEGIPKCTNLPELEAKHGKKLYGFPKTAQDYKDFQLMVMTYQQFLDADKGLRKLNRLCQHVGTAMVDEVHSGAATGYAQVLSRIYTKHLFGVSGTINRKDKREWVLKKVIGPVVASTSVEALTPEVFVHDTKMKAGYSPKGWVAANQKLAKDAKRNALIVEWVMKDIKAGHSIVIPVYYKKHVLELVRLINEAYGRPVAEPFLGGGGNKNKVTRRNILSDAKSGQVKVVVGIRRLLQRGLNVKQWSALYTVMPISNQPNYKQETSRIRTPLEGKQPIIRIFFEESIGFSVGCAKNCLSHTKEFGYKWSQDAETKAAISKLLSSGKRRQAPDEDDEYSVFRASFVEEDDSNLGRCRAGRR